MVVDMISADYQWLHSPDGKEEEVFFKAGKNWEGQFINNEILEQASRIIDILDKHYAGEDYVLVFNNVTTYTKEAEAALSAHNMSKFICKWGVEVNVWGDGWKTIYGPNGKLSKCNIKTHNAKFVDSSPQLPYFESRLSTGLFKGWQLFYQSKGYCKRQ